MECKEQANRARNTENEATDQAKQLTFRRARGGFPRQNEHEHGHKGHVNGEQGRDQKAAAAGRQRLVCRSQSWLRAGSRDRQDMKPDGVSTARSQADHSRLSIRLAGSQHARSGHNKDLIPSLIDRIKERLTREHDADGERDEPHQQRTALLSTSQHRCKSCRSCE